MTANRTGETPKRVPRIEPLPTPEVFGHGISESHRSMLSQRRNTWIQSIEIVVQPPQGTLPDVGLP